MRTFLRASALGIVMTCCILANAKAQDHPAAGLNIPRSSLSDAEQARAIALAEPQAAISSPSALHPDNVSARGTPNRVVVTDDPATARELEVRIRREGLPRAGRPQINP